MKVLSLHARCKTKTDEIGGIPVGIKWLQHGKWPRFLARLHYYTIFSFILLLVSGVALYLPAVHTVLIPYLPLIYQVHILLGLIFGISLLTPFLRLLPKGKNIWRLDWLFPLVFGTAIVLTGLLLWGVTVFPTTWRSPAFSFHGWFSAILGGYLLIHAFLRVFGLRPNKDGFAGRVNPERRKFIRWIGTGAIGAMLLTIFDPFPSLSLFFTGGKRGNGASGGAPTADFAEYYTVVGGFPEMKLANYRLQVTGNVQNSVTLAWSDITAMPPYQETQDFHCVTGWSVPNVRWAGLHLSQLVKKVQPTPAARYVNFYSFDGAYTESLPLAEALDPTVLLAYHLDGQPLPREQGFPLRLVVPKQYGYKSIKWIAKVEFSTQPITGYWEVRGYPSEATL